MADKEGDKLPSDIRNIFEAYDLTILSGILNSIDTKEKQVMKCPKCKADNPDTQKFCGECATSLKPLKDISETKVWKLLLKEWIAKL